MALKVFVKTLLTKYEQPGYVRHKENMKDTICTAKKILTGNMAALLLFELSFRVLLKILSGETARSGFWTGS